MAGDAQRLFRAKWPDIDFRFLKNEMNCGRRVQVREFVSMLSFVVESDESFSRCGNARLVQKVVAGAVEFWLKSRVEKKRDV
jgi:hypothetical protein